MDSGTWANDFARRSSTKTTLGAGQGPVHALSAAQLIPKTICLEYQAKAVQADVVVRHDRAVLSKHLGRSDSEPCSPLIPWKELQCRGLRQERAWSVVFQAPPIAQPAGCLPSSTFRYPRRGPTSATPCTASTSTSRPGTNLATTGSGAALLALHADGQRELDTAHEEYRGQQPHDRQLGRGCDDQRRDGASAHRDWKLQRLSDGKGDPQCNCGRRYAKPDAREPCGGGDSGERSASADGKIVHRLVDFSDWSICHRGERWRDPVQLCSGSETGACPAGHLAANAWGNGISTVFPNANPGRQSTRISLAARIA